MDVDSTKNSLNKAKFSLFTLEYPPDRGGVGRYLFDLGRALGGWRVERAQAFFWSFWPRWVPLIRRVRAERETRAVLVSHVLPVGTVAMLARLLGGSVYGVFFHGMDLLQAERSFWKKWLTKKIIQYSHALFVNSSATACILQRFTDRRPVLVTPGVEPRQFLTREESRGKLGLSLEEKIVLSVGRFVPRKGFDVLIEAMKNVNARLVIIGDGPDRQRLEALVSHASILMSDVSDADRDVWYATADVFALPVREDRGDIEGFGIVFLEAALAGLPVVAGKSGGVSEAVIGGETGLLVDPRDVSAIAGAIRELLDDPGRAQAMGEAARTRVLENFSWEDRVPLVEAAFPLVSVIIPVHADVELLNRVLASLARQTYRYIEVIVVDNGLGSQIDGVVNVWRPYLSIRLERFSTNQGGPVARNHGVSVSTGEYILVLDHDARLKRGAIETFLRTLQEHPEADAVYASHRFGWKRFSAPPFDAELLKRVNYIHTSSLMRRAAFPGFDPALTKFQDWDLWLTMVARGSSMVAINKALFSLKPGGTISAWLPSFAYRLPWEKIGWAPKRLIRYREAERIIRDKHKL